MEKLEVNLLNSSTNGVVVQLPSRRFPGIVIQGDSLSVLVSNAERALKALRNGAISEAQEELEETIRLLQGYQSVYERALNENGIQLPYSKTQH